MNPYEITCDIHTDVAFVFVDAVDYNCTVGRFECPACRQEYEDGEAEYDRIMLNVPPSDPTDRAAWYARRDAQMSFDETARLDREHDAHVALVREMQSTFRHDHPLSI